MDNVIESFDFYDYRPPLSEDIDKVGAEFQIHVYNEDIVTQPCKSSLIINGRINNVGDDKKVSPVDPKTLRIVTNGLMNLFDRIDYFIGDTLIDTVRKPGLTGLIKGLVTLSDDRAYTDAGWQIRTPSAHLPNSDGYFQAIVPLQLVMGFFEDYKQFLYRMPQKLVFNRNNVERNNILLQDAGLDKHTISISLKDIIWRVPQIKFSLAYETKIRNEILKNTTYELRYRNWMYTSNNTVSLCTDYTWDIPVAQSKTKFVLLAFQTADRVDDKTKDNSKFDLCDLESVQVQLNDTKYYPRERLNMKSTERKTALLYQMYKNFKSAYYEDARTLEGPLLDYCSFIADYPIIAIDCSYQPDVIKESLINLKVHFAWRTNLPTNTVIHCVMIMDNKAVYNPLNNRVIH